MNEEELKTLLENLVKQNKESEWIEFKLNFHSEREIGERISALSNGVCLENQPNGYLVFGVKNDNQTIARLKNKMRRLPHVLSKTPKKQE